MMAVIFLVYLLAGVFILLKKRRPAIVTVGIALIFSWIIMWYHMDSVLQVVL